jgi:hypothetical protein
MRRAEVDIALNRKGTRQLSGAHVDGCRSRGLVVAAMNLLARPTTSSNAVPIS